MFQLGDAVERALASAGVTKERVRDWLGVDCRCDERQDKLNRLGHWASRVLRGRTENAARHLDSLLEEPR